MDQEYFENYCGYGDYDSQYLYHSGILHCLGVIDRYALDVREVLVLGAATGQVLGHFEAELDVIPHGCELSEWAHARIPERYQARVKCADMRSYVPALLAEGAHFDMGFTNALIYLDEADVPALLRDCAKLCRYFHYDSSTSEAHEPGDSYATLLRSRTWWREQLLAAGFKGTRSPYLWRSSLD